MKILYLIIISTLFSCKTLQKGKEIDMCDVNNFYQTVEKISFDDIDRIKQLNGKFINIEGFFYGNFEDVALYPSSSSNSSAKALWLNLKIPDSLINKLTKKKVRAIGRFNLSQKGHLNAYLATLDSTFCLKEVEH